MEAVILAAGLGTRLRPYTETKPKPLLAVQGRPILDWTLAALPTPVERVIVVVNYLAEQIEAYMRSQPHFSDWQLVRQSVPRGTGDAFRSCQDSLQSSRYLVLNGDDLYGAADLAALVCHPAGLLVRPVDDPRRWGIADLRADGTIERLVEKPNRDGPALANLGAYVFPREVFEIELKPSPRGEYEITDYVTELAQRMAVQPVRANFWLPIGDVEAWQRAEAADLSALRRA